MKGRERMSTSGNNNTDRKNNASSMLKLLTGSGDKIGSSS
jgi:hypothetical protein